MSIDVMRDFFLWSMVIAYAVLLLWFLVFTFCHDWLRNFHGRWFNLSAELFDAIHYAGMAVFKIGILLFAFVPFIAICVVMS
jgi:hypothetical protein